MATLLVSDTNSAIKLAFCKDKFFTTAFVSLGKVILYRKVVKQEVLDHLKNSAKQRLSDQLIFLRDCPYYDDSLEFDQHEFWSYQASEFQEAKETVLKLGGYLGTSDEDETLLYVAIINKCELITNEYALTHLSKEVGMTQTYTAEDLIIAAVKENKMSIVEAQSVLDSWKTSEEYVIEIKQKELKALGLRI